MAGSAALAPSSAERRRAKPTRAQKVERTRAALLDAAAKVVGEVGYTGASVTAITSRAQVGQGTFYNYFDSRDRLFDQLLPAISEQMLDFIKARGEEAASEQEREEKSFRAFFDFLAQHPEFFRVMYEAEVFAPDAYRRHTEMVLNGFVRILGKARGRGDIAGYDAAQIEALGLILMGARHYLCLRYGSQNGWKEKLPEKVVDAYMTLLRQGLYGNAPAAEKTR
ncbi:MAG: TetR/AcrR family transcriptional regulator [Reyranellaceae bacterium]